MNRFYADLNSKKKRERNSLFLAIFFLIALRFLYFGFKYFPQLDDYIQHHNYAMMGDFSYVIEKLGILAARPIAGILDITVWTWVWPYAIVGVLLLSLLYAFSAIEFQKIFIRIFGTSEFFVIIYALLPLGIEGTYWMSASTRIIPGMFFAAFSASMLLKFFENGQKRDLVLALMFQLLTFGFYEQTAVLSCALNLILGILYIKKSQGRFVFSLGCIVCAGIYFVFTNAFSDSALYSGRTNIILPASAYYFNTFLPDLLAQIKTAFFDGGYYTLLYGFIRGVMRIVNDGAWIYCIFLLLGCLLLGVCIANSKHSVGRGKLFLALLIGVLLTLAPLAPFFIIENPWFSLRSTVPSFVGIAIIFDVLIRGIVGNKKTTLSVFCAVGALVFCISSVSEIADYKATNEADMRVVSTISKIADDVRSETSDNCKVAIFNIDSRYVTEQNFYFHEHVHGVTESDWALTGAVRCYNNNAIEGISYIPFSLKQEMIYKKWEYASKTLSAMYAIYAYDNISNSIERLTVKNLDNTYELYYSNGEKYGTVVENDGCGYFIEE